MDTIAIVWLLQPDTGANRPGRGYGLTVATAGLRGGELHIEKHFPLPSEHGWRPCRRGASETLGLFGGVENEAQGIISEAVERNLSDLITMCCTTIVERLHSFQTSLHDRAALRKHVLIQGPVLPKTAGRLASFRFPREIRFGWLSPDTPFEWLDSYYFLQLFRGPAPVGLETLPWEEEKLLLEEPIRDQERVFLLEYLDVFRARKVPQEFVDATSNVATRKWFTSDTPLPLSFQLASLLLKLHSEWPSPAADPIGFVGQLADAALVSDRAGLEAAVRKAVGAPAKHKDLSDSQMATVLTSIETFCAR